MIYREASAPLAPRVLPLDIAQTACLIISGSATRVLDRMVNLMMEQCLRPTRPARSTKTPSSAYGRFETYGLARPEDVLVWTDPAQFRRRKSDMVIKCNLLN
jgi:hypothetical protein